MLYGLQGTGKSEYVRHLGGLLGDKALVFTADCAEIRKDTSEAPASKLSQLYTKLQEIAKKE